MNRAKLRLGGAVNANGLGGAKLSADEVADEDDTYAFLTQDYLPHMWYYELVTCKCLAQDALHCMDLISVCLSVWLTFVRVDARKLILNGLAIALGRGTMAQTCVDVQRAHCLCVCLNICHLLTTDAALLILCRYFVATTEAFFLMFHMRVYPYTNNKHNLMEALGHCALMLTYAISLILRNNNEEQWAAEWWPREGCACAFLC